MSILPQSLNKIIEEYAITHILVSLDENTLLPLKSCKLYLPFNVKSYPTREEMLKINSNLHISIFNYPVGGLIKLNGIISILIRSKIELTDEQIDITGSELISVPFAVQKYNNRIIAV